MISKPRRIRKGSPADRDFMCKIFTVRYLAKHAYDVPAEAFPSAVLSYVAGDEDMRSNPRISWFFKDDRSRFAIRDSRFAKDLP